MKVSMVIPCAPKDFHKLERVLNFIAICSKIPDEVIIGISQIQNFPAAELINLKKLGSQLFKSFSLSETQEKCWPGPNRQRASEIATGDIIIYQDADDLPHYQRVEFINRFFEDKDIVHLNHAYLSSVPPYNHRAEFDKINIVESDILYKTYFPTGDIKDSVKVTGSYGFNLGFDFPMIHVGATSIRRSVLDKVHWKDVKDLTLFEDHPEKHRTEDFEFCIETLYTFNKSILLDTPLYYYF